MLEFPIPLKMKLGIVCYVFPPTFAGTAAYGWSCAPLRFLELRLFCVHYECVKISVRITYRANKCTGLSKGKLLDQNINCKTMDMQISRVSK